MRVDRSSATPIHRQIYEAIREGIVNRTLRPGQQTPSSRALALELGVSRIPVLEAYAQLLAEGYLETRQGAGTFISHCLPPGGPGFETHRKTKGPATSSPRVISRRVAALPPRDIAPWAARPGAFGVGMPAYDRFPVSVWSSLLAKHSRVVPMSGLNYGDPMGLQGFREALAGYLRTARSVQCDAGQIMVVSGSQQALDLCARVLLDPDEPAWIEEPSYQMMRHALRMSGVRCVPVPVDKEGLDVSTGLRLSSEARLAFVTPSHQYPLGMTMTAARRLQLLDWAHQRGGWIVEDDYDSEFRFESLPIASLQGLDSGSRVIYIGTFSKTLFPAMRLGYLVLPADLVERFVVARRAVDLCPPPLYQSALADFIQQGHFSRHVRRTRMLYDERRKTLVAALRNELGDEVEILGAEAGMHLVITLAKGEDVAISLRAAKEGLWLAPLSTTYAAEQPRHGFILGFGSVEPKDMSRGVAHVKRLLDDARSGHLDME